MFDVFGSVGRFERYVGQSAVRPFRRAMIDFVSSVAQGNDNSPVSEFGNRFSALFRVAVSYSGNGNIPDGNPVSLVETLDFSADFFQQRLSCPGS